MNLGGGVFRVKICGVTTLEDALLAADAGADAIGFNFYARSVRGVDCLQAAQVARSLAPSVARVGVFVNHSAAEIHACWRRVGLNYVQLHGDEPPELARELVGLPVVRALRCRLDTWVRGAAWVESYVGAGGTLAALLVDAYDPNEYGGTGRRADGEVFAAFRSRFPLIPLILAGGLTPENVADVIAEVRPDGVDTASGVEQRPGLKSAEKVREFVRRASAALRTQ
jgi:phosphoribosylanthranilate isomerase